MPDYGPYDVQMKALELVERILTHHGVPDVREQGGTFVPAAHEGSSVLMALAYTHVAGHPGVATVTHGPALTNCITALTEGARGHVPMVLLAGDTPVDNPRHLQGIDQREVVKASGAKLD